MRWYEKKRYYSFCFSRNSSFSTHLVSPPYALFIDWSIHVLAKSRIGVFSLKKYLITRHSFLKHVSHSHLFSWKMLFILGILGLPLLLKWSTCEAMYRYFLFYVSVFLCFTGTESGYFSKTFFYFPLLFISGWVYRQETKKSHGFFWMSLCCFSFKILNALSHFIELRFTIATLLDWLLIDIIIRIALWLEWILVISKGGINLVALISEERCTRKLNKAL
jgi:hypothetical protein